MELVNYWTGEEAKKGRTIEEFARYKCFLQLSLRMRLALASLKFSIFLFKGCCCQGGEADRLTSVHWTLSSLPICELGDNNQLSWFNYQSFNLNNHIVHNNGLNCLTMTL